MNVEEVFKNPVPRSELPKIFNCGDRAAREKISKLCEEYNIVNLQDGRGYVLADEETAIRYAMQERHRGIASLRKANNILKRCENPKIGIVVPVKSHYRVINKIHINKNQITIDELEEIK